MPTMTSKFPKGARMFSRSLLVLAATLSLGACNLLDTSPPDELTDDKTIQNPAGARAALAGAYNALQSGYYYGGTLTHFGDLYGDNAKHVGTFTSYQEADQNDFFANNGDVTGMWNAIYEGIKRVNTIIAKVPSVTGFAPGEQEQIMGEAYFLRALHYHNLVKYYDGVPLRVDPISDPDQAADITRATAAEVYAQILADLAQAEALMTNGTDPDNHGTLGAAKALTARVHLYQGSYALALSKAQEVEALGYTLAPSYSDLWSSDAVDTPEDIFKLTFTLTQANLHGHYWLSDQLSGDAGRFEMGPTQSVIDAYDTLSTDTRLAWNIQPDPNGNGYIEATQGGGSYGSKFPTANGAEDFHVIRFAEVLLIKAEGFAQGGQLDSAVSNYNQILARAGLDTDTVGVDINTQQEILDRIDVQRRLEFFAEGDRFPDLARSGRAVAVLGIPANRVLFPIPQAEIDVAPNVTQNPGY